LQKMYHPNWVVSDPVSELLVVKKKTNSKPTTKAHSSNLPSTNIKSPCSKNSDSPHKRQPKRANANTTSPSPRETGEPIRKRVECASQQQQQPLREVENIMDTNKSRKGVRNEKHPPTNVSNNGQANAAVEDTVLGIPQTKSMVSWKDGTKNNSKKRQTEDIDDIELNGCFDMEPHEGSTDVVESNSFVGFLRSSGFESQAYLVEELGNEVRGLTADTLLAVDQVLNAFKIGDDDIDAIVGNIHQEKNCLAKHIRY